MLKYPGPGNRPLFGHVPDQEDRNPNLLCEAHQPRRRLAHLGDAAGAALESRIRARLDGIDDCELWRRRPDRLADGVQVVLAKEQDPRLHRDDPMGSHADLLWGFLASS